jgi:peptide/nickel transport system ATP-binding protein
MSAPLIAVDHVSRQFVKPLGWAEKLANRLGGSHHEVVVRALDEVTLEIQRGEVLGVVGESGCGKSTLGRIVAGLLPASSGSVAFKPASGNAQLARQMIFQDPSASLNPRLRVVDQVGEAAVAHGFVAASAMRDYVADLLQEVGLDSTALTRYPHQFSGGQRARIGIARALAVKPELLVCDESVAALDVSIQAQVLNLFAELRQSLGLTYMFISHDLGVVQHLSTRVAVMYLGRVVEVGSTAEIFASPKHPYTQALLEAMPRIRTGHQAFAVIKGEVASPVNPPSGCHFHPRCPRADAKCAAVAPALARLGSVNVACHYV